MKLSEVKNSYRTWIDTNLKDKSENTRKQYRVAIQDLLNFLSDKLDPEEVITSELYQSYKNYLIDSGRATSTINTKLSVLNKFFKANKADLKLEFATVKKSNVDTDSLKDSEYKKLIRWSNKLATDPEQSEQVRKRATRTGLIMKTLARTGIRINELQFITVECLKKSFCIADNKNRERYVIIPKELKKELRAYCRKNNITSGMIFRSDRDNSKKLDRSTITRDMKFIAGKARGIKLDKVHPHALRHYFSKKYMKTEGAFLYDLQDLLGHTTNSVTAHYTRKDPEEHLPFLNKVEQNIIAQEL